jgi:hypothetical protein
MSRFIGNERGRRESGGRRWLSLWLWALLECSNGGFVDLGRRAWRRGSRCVEHKTDIACFNGCYEFPSRCVLVHGRGVFFLCLGASSTQCNAIRFGLSTRDAPASFLHRFFARGIFPRRLFAFQVS